MRIWILTALGLGSLAGAALAQPVPRLFRQRPLPLTLPSHPAAAAEYEVEVATARLPAATRLTLELPDGRVFPVRRTAFERRSARDYSWTGRVQLPIGEADLVLAVKDDAVAGAVLGLGTTWEIVPGSLGRQRLVQLDPAWQPECVEAPPRGSASAIPVMTSPAVQAAAGDSADRIDVLVVYTAAARSGAGGQTQIEAAIQAAVDSVNSVWANSEISARMRLAHADEISYVESGDPNVDLPWVRGDAAVARLRDAYAADMVSLWVESFSPPYASVAGIGYIQDNPGPGFASSAFQVTRRSTAIGNLTFAHEFGHNQGAEHDPPNGSPPETASYMWSFGHFDIAKSVRTVMSYANAMNGCSGCSQIPHFSNPGVTYAPDSWVTGIADQRDNHPQRHR
jgi:hypothetical protein